MIMILRLALAAIFAAAALGKLSNMSATRRTLSEFGVADRLTPAGAILLPATEVGIAVSLLPADWARWGGLAATAMLCLFSAAIVRVLARGEKPDCNCFGSVGSRPVGAGTLVRNGALASLAVAVIVGSWGTNGSHLDAWIRGHGQLAVVFGVIGLLAAFQFAFSWQIFKQNGRLLRRVDELESAGLGQEGDRPGLPVGELGPAFALPDLDGNLVSLDDLLEPGRGVLLAFTDPSCSHCTALLPALGRAQAEGSIPVAVISAGSVARNRANAAEAGVEHLLLQAAHEVAALYQAHGSPSAVLLRADGRVARGLASGAGAVAELLATLAVRALEAELPRLTMGVGRQ